MVMKHIRAVKHGTPDEVKEGGNTENVIDSLSFKNGTNN
jgi:hypothetical protein